MKRNLKLTNWIAIILCFIFLFCYQLSSVEALTLLSKATEMKQQELTYRPQQELLNSFSDDALEFQLRDYVAKWMQDQEIFEGKDFEMRVLEKKPFLVNEQKGYKVYPSWDIEVKLLFDWKTFEEKEGEVTSQVCRKAGNDLCQIPLFQLLVHSLDIRCAYPNGVTRQNITHNQLGDLQDYTQDERLTLLQDKILQMTEEMDGQLVKVPMPRRVRIVNGKEIELPTEVKEICLSEFGVTDENRLYAKIKLYQEPEVAGLREYLQGKSQQLWTELESDVELKQAYDSLNLAGFTLMWEGIGAEPLKEPLQFQFP